MDVTSDHSTLLTSVNWDSQAFKPPKRLRIETLDTELFTDLLTENCKAFPQLTDSPTLEEIDDAATGLTYAISNAFNGSAKRTLGQNSGYPWWDEDCKAAVRANRAYNSPETARALRNTVRKAKRQ